MSGYQRWGLAALLIINAVLIAAVINLGAFAKKARATPQTMGPENVRSALLRIKPSPPGSTYCITY